MDALKRQGGLPGLSPLQLTPRRAYLGGAILGVIAFLWAPAVLAFVTLISHSDALTWDGLLLYGLPGLFPAWGSWALFDWAKRVEAAAAFNAPASVPSSPSTGAAAVQPRSGQRLIVIVCAALIFILVGLQLVTVTLLLIDHLAQRGVDAGSIAFVVLDLAPAAYGLVLGRSLLLHVRKSGRGLVGGGPGEVAVRAGMLGLGVFLVFSSAVISVFQNLLYLSLTWGRLGIDLAALLLVIGPCILLMGGAGMAVQAAVRE